MEQETSLFVDAENQQQGFQANISFIDICLRHLERIAILGSKEFRGGYWQQRLEKVGNITFTSKVYVPDSRMEYVNAVNMLYDLSLGYFDKEMKQEYKIIIEEEQKLDKTDKDYIDNLVQLKRKMFQQLSLLLYRLKYFQGKKFEGGG